jgi:hypothetical protein
VKVIVYSAATTHAVEKVKKISEVLIPQPYIELHHSINSLSERLKKQTTDVGVIILIANSKKELSGLFIIRDQLLDLRTVLILPDREDDTLSKGHSLYPRFLSYIDSDFNTLSEVLEKMFTNLHLSLNTKNEGVKKNDRNN